jgi:hypothetical protein
MIMIYAIALIIVLTDADSTNTLVYSMPTWKTCIARKAALVEGMKGRSDPEAVTVDCRHDVQVNLGMHEPKPPEADAAKEGRTEAGAGF